MLYRRCASFFSSLWRRVSHIALSRGISRVLRSFGLCFVAVLALTLSPLFSLSANALDFVLSDDDFHLADTNSQPYWTLQRSNGNFITTCTNQGWEGGNWINPVNVGTRVVLGFFNSGSCQNPAFTLNVGSVMQVQFRTKGLTVDEITLASSQISPIYISVENQGPNSYWTVSFQNKQQSAIRVGNVNMWVIPTESQQGLEVLNWTIFDKWGNSSPDYSGSLNNINSSINNVNGSIQGVISGVGGVQSSVNNAANQAHQDSQAEIDAINDQTQQQQDQYEQDKAEESQREDDMDSQASQAESMFSFTFLNPFIGIFELFNNSGCVSIPTIAGMVGSDETTYCPWFDSSVRNILTPVFGFSSMILLFGFVIYWLRGGSSDILYKGGK